MQVAARVMVVLWAISMTGLAACTEEASKPLHLGVLPSDIRMMLSFHGMDARAPMFIRVFKQESELEIWKQKADGQFHLFTSYPICRYSGNIGPKLRERDRQAPEGFYEVSWRQMQPHSKYHLAFNLGFPNRLDKSHGRTGSNIMIHGGCKSAGCYAMTDDYVEEIYLLARDALKAGQEAVQVHAFPFRMTDENMAAHKGSQWFSFWQDLKAGYDSFEQTRRLPDIVVRKGRYHVTPMPAAASDLAEAAL